MRVLAFILAVFAAGFSLLESGIGLMIVVTGFDFSWIENFGSKEIGALCILVSAVLGVLGALFAVIKKKIAFWMLIIAMFLMVYVEIKVPFAYSWGCATLYALAAICGSFEAFGEQKSRQGEGVVRGNSFFDDMGKVARKLAALLLAVTAGAIFSVYVEPAWGAWLPRWLYRIPKTIFGEVRVLHTAGMIGAVMSTMFVVFLALRRFVSAIDKSVYGIIIFGVDIYVMALLFDVVFGDTSKFLQGGVTSMTAIAAYALCLLGMKEYVPMAMLALLGLCVVNVISAESVLALPGSVGMILMFLSMFLQCDNFIEKLGSISLDLRGK